MGAGAVARRGAATRFAVALVIASSIVAVASGCTGAATPGDRASGAGATPASSADPTSADPSSAEPPDAPLPDGITVEIEQERSDYGDRRLEVRVANANDVPFLVRSASFSSPNFVSPVASEKPGTVGAGLSLDFPVLLPAPVCSGDRSAPPSVTLVFQAGEGSADSRAEVLPTDPLGSMVRINGEDCLAESVGAVVAVTPATDLRVEGTGSSSTAYIDLALAPTRASGTVFLDTVGQTPLLAPVGGAVSWPVGLTISGNDGPQTLSFAAQPGRCEPHVIAEDKRGTFLPLTVTVTPVDSAPVSGTYYVALSDRARVEVYRWLADHCGF